jgi:hypothetical protein
MNWLLAPNYSGVVDSFQRSSRLVSSLFFSSLSSRRFNINNLISCLLLQTQCKFRIKIKIDIELKVLARARARANASLRVVSSVICRSPDIIFIHVVSILLIIELTIVRYSQLRSVLYSFYLP